MSSATQKPKPRAVLDSNVIISGFTVDRVNPAAIIDLLWKREIQAYVSLFIFEEVSRTLRGRRFRWAEPDIEEAITFLSTYCTVIDPPPESSLDELSPEDNRVLDCAIQGQVQYLVTGDKGILQLGQYENISIVTPREFLAVVQQQS